MGRVQEAFKAVPRREFLREDYQSMAGIDEPLPIGFGQTNSQPSTIGRMLDWLAAEPGDEVLDVGSGSGWSTALLAHIVGPRGRVYAVEIIPELVEWGSENCHRLGIENICFHQAVPGIYGLPAHGPYDCILVSASASELPHELVDQLKAGGRLVVPVGSDILEIIKQGENNYDTFVHPGFAFVPLVAITPRS